MALARAPTANFKNWPARVPLLLKPSVEVANCAQTAPGSSHATVAKKRLFFISHFSLTNESRIKIWGFGVLRLVLYRCPGPAGHLIAKAKSGQPPV
jgi:hypothetical protein